MSQKKQCHIVGAGAIGQYFAYELSQSFSICLHARNDTLKSIELEDIHCKGHRLNLIEDNKKDIQLLILCTKSFQALDAFKQYQHRLNSNSIVICLFNGLGPQFEIEAMLGSQPQQWVSENLKPTKSSIQVLVKHSLVSIQIVQNLQYPPLTLKQ